ncbi:uncharacterized protein LOC118826857 isoform X1 [Colossoma macropomum]|uniref:uncharacterized protein LOC118826857 isoform X1 n=1 Tax=Colossoma macropomum TaxID=42526 RepID=UPI001864DA69|nr:uncharacterized protein LOC118826857 isoform X1 [Colossoma macropomum]XP_036453776.1 uncharacterized protein LOC118826857 isoform X1 [Colossoma macropomum]
MKTCSSAHCVLILLITTGSESAVPSVMVKLHDSATLSCSERCSGLVRWTVFHKPTEVLAECDQTSCRSKEGYQMIHDQYLKGNLSLTITEADFTKRGWYTCVCDGKDLCDASLKIEPLNTPLQINPGESLELKLDIPDPVELIYNSTGSAGRSSGQICTVEGRSAQCKPEYKLRASLTSVIKLRAVTPSDSGVYSVMDKRNEEVIHIYTVTVKGDSDAQKQNHRLSESCCSALSDDQLQPCRAALPVWVFVVVVVVVAVVFAVLGGMIVWLWKNQQLQNGPPRNEIPMDDQGNPNPEALEGFIPQQ